jgi:hypothetical protein
MAAENCEGEVIMRREFGAMLKPLRPPSLEPLNPTSSPSEFCTQKLKMILIWSSSSPENPLLKP